MLHLFLSALKSPLGTRRRQVSKFLYILIIEKINLLFLDTVLLTLGQWSPTWGRGNSLQGGIWPSLVEGGGATFKNNVKTSVWVEQNTFNLIIKYRASDSLNFYEIKLN